MPEEKKSKSNPTACKSAPKASEDVGKKPDAMENPVDAGLPRKSVEKSAPTDTLKKSAVPAKPTESKPSVPTEQKESAGSPIPADAARKPDTPTKATVTEPEKAPEVKAAIPEATKSEKVHSNLKQEAAESKQAPAAPAADLKKANDLNKPVNSKDAISDIPKTPDATGALPAVQKKAEPKSTEEKSHGQETPNKTLSQAATAVDPQKKAGEKAGAAGLGLQITRIFADRLDYPDEKAQKSLPVPKEGEGFSMRLHPAYFHEFLDHPFSINREVKDYKDLYESIRDNGISEPVLARPGKNGGLELISGHRRHDIARQLNYPIPVVIRQIDDDTAQIGVVDGNLHRQDIPTSELARAAKMKMDALARKAGRRSKMEQITAPQKRTDEIVGQDMGMSRNQVQRLVRIDALVPELKQQVDDKKLPFNTAVELSYLKPDEQHQVVDFMEKQQVTPSMAQATQLKEASRHAATLERNVPSLAASHKVDEKKVAEIITPRKEPERKVTLTAAELKAYFPSPLPGVPEIKQAVFEALSMRNKALAKQASKEAAKKAIKPVR